MAQQEVSEKRYIVNGDQLQRLLKATVPEHLPVMVSGMPGVGKTAIVEKVSLDLSCALQILHPVVSDPTDAKGMPWIYVEEKTNKPKAVFIPFGELEAMMNATGLTIVLLDDLGQAPPAVQAAFMQLILARQINGKKISDHVVFIACTNRKEDRAGVSGILEPVKSRFATIVELVPHQPSWNDWAISAGIEPELVAFIAMRPCYLEGGEEGWRPTSDMTNSAVPRTVHSLDKLIKLKMDADVKQPAYAGCVGAAMASEFIGFEDILKNLPDMGMVLSNPNKADAPGARDVQFAMIGVFQRRMNKGNIDNIYRYLELHFRPELQAVFHFNVEKYDKSLIKTKGYVNWSAKHGAEFSN